MVKAFLLFILGLLSLVFADTQDLINAYCNGETPCYLCTDGQQIGRCNLGCLDGSQLEGNKCIKEPNTTLIRKTAFSFGCSIWGDCHISNCCSPFCLATSEHPPNMSGRFCKTWDPIEKRDYLCKVIYFRGYTDCYATTYSCPKGYTLQNGKCVRPADWICPLGNYQCYNPLTTPTVSEDTIEGAGDLQNDGQITEQGCLGTIYIFNGYDYRCRPPGIQTGFSDCCKKEHTWFGLGMCSERERYLSRLRAWGQRDGRCHYVGKYCAEKWLGVCVQKKKTFCCYSSPLARIIIEAAHQQLGIPWGDPKHPNCRGLTPEEFQKLDFSKIDFSEWISYEIQQNIVPSINTSLSNAINNLQTTVSTSVPSSP